MDDFLKESSDKEFKTEFLGMNYSNEFDLYIDSIQRIDNVYVMGKDSVFFSKVRTAQSAVAVEYTDCISVEG